MALCAPSLAILTNVGAKTTRFAPRMGICFREGSHLKPAYHQKFVAVVEEGDETYLPVHLEGVIRFLDR